MANSVTSQTYDGARNYQIKLVIVCDGSGDISAQKIVDVTTLVPNPGAHLKLKRVKYSIEGMSIRLQWEGTPNRDLAVLSTGESELDFSNAMSGGVPDDATTPTGCVLLSTIGSQANSNATLFLEFIKGV